MSLNSYICKHFDKDENGNVTVGSIFIKEEVSFFTTITLIISFANIITTEDFDITVTNILYTILNTLLYIIIIVIFMKILYNVLIYVSNITIAKCPLEK